ncbi:transcriptional regulator [Brevibacillus laterosporus]|uniref:LacI family DNA-binding transcriptional regulator n=1 Tax=Brevibacillus laterosporus TaxID=1465 RepID=UPI000CE2E1FD|nr:LacI family DNA-binding transcriptional regulator [Brevibacillus laterosporus]PPA87295.1 transcriptional regulator [Brevibacillus laterosporus]
MATIRDVAKLAGVSVATVSRVLNKTGYVNVETGRKVEKAIQQLQYEPNSVARGLAGKRTSTIAFILPDITNPFFSEMARGVEDKARELGYTVILCNSDDQGQKEKTYIEVLKKKYIDGIIIASQTLRSEDIQKMQQDQIPLVVMDRAPENQHCSVIRCNNYVGAKEAVAHLVEQGCRKIGHIYGPQELITARERMLAYEESVQGFAWYSPSLMEPGYFQLNGGQEAVKELLRRHPDIDGIFVGNDLMAIGVLKGLNQLGRRVPEDVAVCGFDGIALASMTIPELTTVAQPIYEMGELAALTLTQQIESTKLVPSVFELEPIFIERSSTRRESLG